MFPTRPTRGICAVLCVLACYSVAAAADDHQVTIYSWPTTSSAPQELAKISYNPDTAFSAVTSYTPPKVATSSGATAPDDLVRVGLYDPKTTNWRGVVTEARSFNSELQQKIQLHVDDDSRVWHVGFAAYPKPKPLPGKSSDRKKTPPAEPAQVVVKIVKPNLGPTPHLNKPVVLNADGRVADKEQEKTFLQKYWWAIGLFLLVQVLLSGGGGEEK